MPHPEKKSSNAICSQFYDPFHSYNPSIVRDALITGLFDQVLWALLCHFSPTRNADFDFFGLLTKPCSLLTSQTYACGKPHTFAWAFSLVFEQPENLNNIAGIDCVQLPSLGVPAGKPFIHHQMIGPLGVIEVLA